MFWYGFPPARYFIQFSHTFCTWCQRSRWIRLYKVPAKCEQNVVMRFLIALLTTKKYTIFEIGLWCVRPLVTMKKETIFLDKNGTCNEMWVDHITQKRRDSMQWKLLIHHKRKSLKRYCHPNRCWLQCSGRGVLLQSY